jgi:anti-anti-sigma factor
MALEFAVRREDIQSRSKDAAAIVAAAGFRVEVARYRDAVRVSPVGELDLATIGQLRGRIDEVMAAGADCVVLDLRETTFLDSTGLHLTVEVDAHATRTGIDFAIVPGPPAVHRIFEATGLGERLPFVDAPDA